MNRWDPESVIVVMQSVQVPDGDQRWAAAYRIVTNTTCANQQIHHGSDRQHIVPNIYPLSHKPARSS